MLQQLNLSKANSPSKSHVSPHKQGGGQYRTPTKKQKNTFPTTPRSVEKQKKVI